jgi:hypothetical protein
MLGKKDGEEGKKRRDGTIKEIVQHHFVHCGTENRIAYWYIRTDGLVKSVS